MKLNEILDKSEDFALVNFYNYADDLLKYLFDIYGLRRDQFKVDLDMAGVLIDISTAIPLGLILNELLSDKLKDFQECEIKISLKSYNGNVKLKINYEGPCKETADENRAKPYLQLIETLLGQFNGSIEFEDEGNEIDIVLGDIHL
jgi:two-component sensor histidine kinase